MRVLFLAHSFPRHATDMAGAFLLLLARALTEEEVEVRVVAPSAPGYPARESIADIPIERFRYAPRRAERLAYTGNMAVDVRRSWSARAALAGFMGAGLLAAARARRRFAADIIHAHWWFPAGVTGVLVGRFAGVPLVTTMHGTDVRLARDVRGARPLFRSVMRRSTVVTTVSRWLANEAMQIAPGVRIDVAPMPVDTSLFSPGGERNRSRVLFVGRFTRQKGIDHLLHAVMRMRTPVAVDLVGDGPERDHLRALVAALGLEGRVRFHGTLPPERLVPLYRRAGAVVVPSQEEGLGLVAVEAQLCGAPVIASASGGLTDVIEDRVTGILVPPGDTAAIAAALDDVLSGEEWTVQLGLCGRERALAGFAPRAVARRYADFYRTAREAAR